MGVTKGALARFRRQPGQPGQVPAQLPKRREDCAAVHSCRNRWLVAMMGHRAEHKWTAASHVRLTQLGSDLTPVHGLLEQEL